MSLRARRLKKVLAEKGLTGMAVSSTSNMLYLAGIPIQSFERFAALLVPTDSEPALVLPELEAEKAREQSDIKDVRSYSDESGPSEVIARALTDLKITHGRLGVERTLPFDFCSKILKAAPNLKMEDATGAVMELRLKKEPQELSFMKKAGQIVEKGIQAGVDSIEVGATELQIGFEIEKEIRMLGGEKVPFNAVLAGGNAALPHGESSESKVRKGDCVLMDVSATYHGYYADLSRTVFVGEISSTQRRVYETVLAAQTAAISSIRPGVVAGSLDRKARAVISKAGFGDRFIHRTGHGLGLDVHEDPSITSACPLVLQPGMTFTVEPGIYLPGKLGVRIEDDLLVTDEGGTTLGRCDKEILVL
ncbi:MAG TPA: Xaa-Pro peptidase family protein [Conexivisphaerales archaeon]|nr:Xaa-Pro peptidase family protein [Conexivisphaerales archaeon]